MNMPIELQDLERIDSAIDTSFSPDLKALIVTVKANGDVITANQRKTVESKLSTIISKLTNLLELEQMARAEAVHQAKRDNMRS
jgi:hypothetical protein